MECDQMSSIFAPAYGSHITSIHFAVLDPVIQKILSCGLKNVTWHLTVQRKPFILLVKKKNVINSRYVFSSLRYFLLAILFFMLGNNWEIEQPVQGHSHAQQSFKPNTFVMKYCPDERKKNSSRLQASGLIAFRKYLRKMA